MNDLQTAAQQALEALEYENSWHEFFKVRPYASTVDAITALRAALAQPDPQDAELSAALGWPGGISEPVLDRKTLLQQVATLRAALAQQAAPQQAQRCRAEPRSDGDYACDCKIGACPGRSAEPAQQAEPLNLSDRAVQRRLAAQWGYVPAAAQAEPVEPHRWEGDNNIESPFNACMHKTYCMTLKQAEPAQEPVAWNWMLDGQPYGQAYYGNPPDTDIAERAAIAGRTVRLLYTAPPPPQRKPLTEEEIGRFCDEVYWSPRQLVRAVERAHGIKE